MSLIQKLFSPAVNETLWHKYNGWRSWFNAPGQMWRRKHNGKWEYKQDEEPYEDWADRNAI